MYIVNELYFLYTVSNIYIILTDSFCETVLLF